MSLGILVNLTPRIASASLIYFISKLEEKNDFVSFTISKSVLKISISSTYRQMITPISFSNL